MREAIEIRVSNILKVLSTRQRLPGYVELKITRVLPHLRRTLEKINEGTYGLCDDCPETIPAERLTHVPGAIRCVSCQEDFEKQHAH